jgi:hypothetical protein
MILALIPFAFLVAAAPPAAQPAAGSVRAQNPLSLVEALHAAGYAAKLDVDNVGDPRISSASGGTKFEIYFYGCSDHKQCTTVDFHAGYHLDKPVPPEKISDWNVNHRFGRAYLDKDKDPVIEMDVDLDAGGMTEALFVDNLELWASVMGGFERQIGFRDN